MLLPRLSVPENRCPPIEVWRRRATRDLTTPNSRPGLRLRHATEALSPLNTELASRRRYTISTYARNATLDRQHPLTRRQDYTHHVRHCPLPALLQTAAALSQMGLDQQARILLLHHRRLHRTRTGGNRTPDPEIYGRGADSEDSHDIPRYVRGNTGAGFGVV
jgi:hypothetical protein